MTGVEQLPTEPQALMEIILRQQAELGARDLHIERIQQEAAAAVAQREAALIGRQLQIERIERESAAALAEREARIEQIKREAADQMEALRLKHQAEVHALLRRFYGPRNERFDPAQLVLFGQLVAAAPADAAADGQAPPAPKTRAERRRDKHGRQKLPSHLERVAVPCDLSDDKKVCPCCGKVRRCIGKVISEILEFFPACFKVLEIIQHKYACGDCDANGLNPQIELAPKPPQPIEKGLPGPGLIAYVVTSKCADHLPLYRLMEIFERHGVHIADSTMCGWIEKSAELVAPLVVVMKQRAKQSKVIKTDETRLPVQEKKQCKKGRMWAYLGDWYNPYIIFEYTPDRTNQWPVAWLEGFGGFLQADAYAGYDAVYRAGTVIEVACWAHARRKFFDAKDTDARRSAEMLEMIRQLYAVEDEAKKRIALLPDATQQQKDEIRRRLRQSQSVPVLKKIKEWLDKEGQLVLPRSPMAEAINYTLNQWQALCVYAEHGFLDIDNNGSERALKLIAIGRRNWLFVGNDEFGKHYATFYSLIASAKLHGLDPQEYLRHVLTHIAETPLSELDQFLPDVYKARLEAAKAAGKATLPAGSSPSANTSPPATAPVSVPGPGP
jgi:transposase